MTASPPAQEAGKRERDKGAIEILCKEIGFKYDAALERPDVLVAFISVLVGEIEYMILWRKAICDRLSSPCDITYNTDEAIEPLRCVAALLADPFSNREERCAELHNGPLSQDDDGPCNHLIDMLSSCVSAIRFGLEVPCHSRHAASAADHIWKHKYGISLFDECTSAWGKDWARQKLQQAITSLMPPLKAPVR